MSNFAIAQNEADKLLIWLTCPLNNSRFGNSGKNLPLVSRLRETLYFAAYARFGDCDQLVGRSVVPNSGR